MTVVCKRFRITVQVHIVELHKRTVIDIRQSYFPMPNASTSNFLRTTIKSIISTFSSLYIPNYDFATSSREWLLPDDRQDCVDCTSQRLKQEHLKGNDQKWPIVTILEIEGDCCPTAAPASGFVQYNRFHGQDKYQNYINSGTSTRSTQIFIQWFRQRTTNFWRRKAMPRK